MPTELYFLTLISGTIFCYFLLPSVVRHGYTNASLSKNLFFVFYLSGIIYLALNARLSFFLLHLCRRVIECHFFRYKKSKMNVFQLFLGISYYIVMSDHLMNYQIGLPMMYVALNLLQTLCHFLVFRKGVRLIHYVSEFMIYLYLLHKIKTPTMFLNLVWIFVYFMVTVAMREEGKGPEKEKHAGEKRRQWKEVSRRWESAGKLRGFN